LFDSGASRYITGYINDFLSIVPINGAINTAGDTKLLVDGYGTVYLTYLLPDSLTYRVELIDILYSKELN
ncbi:hypothetical protein K490DRAFT_37640, partial [Saccharata proteae CBS 121410]